MATVKTQFFLLLIHLFLSTSINGINGSETHSESQESDRIINLPGQPSSRPISQFSGYVTVNEEHGRALFYWFFEAQSEPTQKPLLLWLNGGPGCSSIGYGEASELGPLRVGKNGANLHFNKYSWNKAEDNYNFLVNWFHKFPRYKGHDFFISGESYAGHYVPQLAELLYDRNQDTKNYPHINFKGFIVGNPETNDYYDYKGLLEYAWSHSVISDQLYYKAKQVCDFSVPDWSNECDNAMITIFEAYREIDIYNIYSPICLINSTSSSSSSTKASSAQANNYGLRKVRRIPAGYDPCYSPYAGEYFNRADVQASLHVKIMGNFNGKWNTCNDFGLYNFTVFSTLPIYTKLIQGGLKIWIYSGDIDGRVPVIGSRYCVEALGLPMKSPWRSWFHDHQVAGRIVGYEGLTFVTVRGAGHLVPLNKPSEALAVIHSFLSGDPLPSHR